MNCQAQFFENGGAISTSMAGLNANSANVWSVNNNVGQLANLENATISVGIFQPFLMSDFATGSLVFGVPVKNGAFGLSYSNYGNQYIQFHSSGLAYSMNLGENLQSGIKFNHYYINAGENYNSKSVFSADFGIAAQLTKELFIGISLINPTLSKLADFETERVPTIMQFAVGYQFSKELTLQTAVKKDLAYPISFLAAIDYRPYEKICFRGGIGTNPNKAAFGIGTKLKKIQIDFSSQFHQILGWSPDFSISYQFK